MYTFVVYHVTLQIKFDALWQDKIYSQHKISWKRCISTLYIPCSCRLNLKLHIPCISFNYCKICKHQNCQIWVVAYYSTKFQHNSMLNQPQRAFFKIVPLTDTWTDFRIGLRCYQILGWANVAARYLDGL